MWLTTTTRLEPQSGLAHPDKLVASVHRHRDDFFHGPSSPCSLYPETNYSPTWATPTVFPDPQRTELKTFISGSALSVANQLRGPRPMSCALVLPIPMATHSYTWLPLASHGCLWLPMACSEQHVATHDYTFLPIAAPGRLWRPMAAPGYPWLSTAMAAHDSPWLPMAALAYHAY